MRAPAGDLLAVAAGAEPGVGSAVLAGAVATGGGGGGVGARVGFASAGGGGAGEGVGAEAAGTAGAGGGAFAIAGGGGGAGEGVGAGTAGAAAGGGAMLAGGGADVTAALGIDFGVGAADGAALGVGAAGRLADSLGVGATRAALGMAGALTLGAVAGAATGRRPDASSDAAPPFGLTSKTETGGVGPGTIRRCPPALGPGAGLPPPTPESSRTLKSTSTAGIPAGSENERPCAQPPAAHMPRTAVTTDSGATRAPNK